MAGNFEREKLIEVRINFDLLREKDEIEPLKYIL